MKPEASTALHGVVSLAAGFLLMALLSGNLAVYSVMDLTERILSWPELPASVTRTAVERTASWFVDTTSLQREIQALREENLHLRQGLRETAHEAALTESPGLLQARVTLRRPGDWWKELRIDKGSAHGVEKGMAVLQEGFLAGRITRVNRTSSWVELLTSPALMIPAVVEDTRDLGVIAGDGEGGIRLMYVPLENLLSPGMKLSSTMVSEHLAPGLQIGEVGEATGVSGGYRIYAVVPGAEFSRLYRVQVSVKSVKKAGSP